VKVRRIDDVSGDTVEAKVARAQIALDKGDVRGAMKELQSLDGAPAQAATPFMNQAACTLAADNATQMLTQQVLQQLSGQTGFSLEGLFSGAANDSPETLSGLPQNVPYLSPALQERQSSFVK